MITNILNRMSTIFQAPATNAPKIKQKPIVENPFASPFVNSPFKKHDFEWKNQPVKGGYFAGYHDGKPNIVGGRLFISV